MLKKILTTLVMSYAATTFAALDVNTATVAELDGVNGIGPSMSAKILDERNKGPFKDWNDFVERVKGIRQSKAAKLSAAGMTVNGLTYATAEAKTDAARK